MNGILQGNSCKEPVTVVKKLKFLFLAHQMHKSKHMGSTYKCCLLLLLSLLPNQTLWGAGDMHFEQVPLVYCQHDLGPLRSPGNQFDPLLVRSPERVGTCPRSPSMARSKPSSNLVHLPSNLESFLLYCKGTDFLMSSSRVAIKINYPEYVIINAALRERSD